MKMAHRIYVKRKGTHSLRNIIEIFPLAFDKAKESIISKSEEIRDKLNNKPTKVEYVLKDCCEFKGMSYSFDNCIIDIGNIHYDGEAFRGKNSYLVETIRVISSEREELGNIEKKFGLKGTFLS
jgi:hypothetical protein